MSTNGEACVVIPAAAFTLAGFRAWSHSNAFPEHGRIAFVNGEIIVEMSPERLGSHNAIRVEIDRVICNLITADDLGKFYGDGARFVNKEAAVSNEPDSMAVLWETFENGVVRDVPTVDGDDWIELEGTPDWVLEIVGPSSVAKDTVHLFERYQRAGVPEYWLIDVRGERVSFTIYLNSPNGYRKAPAKGGWQKSRVFGKQFRLVRFKDRRGRPAFRLEMK